MWKKPLKDVKREGPSAQEESVRGMAVRVQCREREAFQRTDCWKTLRINIVARVSAVKGGGPVS